MYKQYLKCFLIVFLFSQPSRGVLHSQICGNESEQPTTIYTDEIGDALVPLLADITRVKPNECDDLTIR